MSKRNCYVLTQHDHVRLHLLSSSIVVPRSAAVDPRHTAHTTVLESNNVDRIGAGKSINIFIVADSVHMLAEYHARGLPRESCPTFKLPADECIVNKDAQIAILLANINLIFSNYNM